MPSRTVFVTDYTLAEELDLEAELLEEVDAEIARAQCSTEEEVLAQIGDPDAIITQWAPVTRQALERCTKCRVISRNGVGVDNIDLEAARERGIIVANVPNYCVPEVADHAMALVLALGRRIVVAAENTRAGEWDSDILVPMFRLKEQVLGIFGLGTIGSGVAERGKPFFREVLVCDPHAEEERLARLGCRRGSAEEVLREADYTTLHVPHNEATHHLIDAAALEQMKPTAYLINTCRGAVVDTEALVAALRAGQIAGAGLDVHEEEPLPRDHPLRGMSNVILTPHTAFYSEEAVREARVKTVENIVRVFRGEEPASRIV